MAGKPDEKISVELNFLIIKEIILKFYIKSNFTACLTLLTGCTVILRLIGQQSLSLNCNLDFILCLYEIGNCYTENKL